MYLTVSEQGKLVEAIQLFVVKNNFSRFEKYLVHKQNLNCLFVCSIFILLSRESNGGAYVGRIRTRLGVVNFQVFWLFL